MIANSTLYLITTNNDSTWAKPYGLRSVTGLYSNGTSNKNGPIMIRSVKSKIQSIKIECDLVQNAMTPSAIINRTLPIMDIFIIYFSYFSLFSFFIIFAHIISNNPWLGYALTFMTTHKAYFGIRSKNICIIGGYSRKYLKYYSLFRILPRTMQLLPLLYPIKHRHI